MMSIWNPDRELMLRNLHAIGLTPQQIADRMGAGMTRANVINKCWEMGLACSSPPIPTAPREKYRPDRSEPARPITLAPLPVSRGLMTAE